jgi:class 3 adenylate cyclase/tetratricopeptide (TPR) repeat protein
VAGRGAEEQAGGVDEGLVIVLFTDVEGSTELSTRRGDVAARDLLRVHEELVRTQVASHRGHEVRGLGDGFLVTFSSARRALSCAVGIQRALDDHAGWAPHEHLRVRVGLNAGDAAEEHGELYGAAVHAAARICAQARGGQILAASVVKELAGTLPGITFLDRGWVRLRGLAEDTHLHEVTWQRQASSRSGPPRTALVGRGHEMAALTRLVEGTLAGRGTLVMLTGEPGVGKTRLVEEVTGAAARSGVLALSGHCHETAGTPSYGPFVEVIEAATRTVPANRLRAALGDDAAEVARIAPELHRFFPQIPPPVTLPADHERRYLFNSVQGFLHRASRMRPLLLVLEDLHWADEATLMLLRHLAERVRDVPMMVLGTYRDVEVDVTHPLAQTVEAVVRRRLGERIAVTRLPRQDVAAMVGAITGRECPDAAVAAIHAGTEGNPFFVEEVVRYLVDERRLTDERGRLRPDVALGGLDVPDRVRLVIGRRLERIGGDARRVLTEAALVGRVVDAALLETMSDLDGERWLVAVEEVERARLLVPDDDAPSARYHFAHELIRQTLVAGISLPRRQRLHLRIAQAMQALEARGLRPFAGAVAHHLVEAGALADPSTTIHYLRIAADHAQAAAAFHDALDHVRTALDLLPEGDQPARATLCEKLAQVLQCTGQWDEALDAWREALAGSEQAGDSEAVGRVCAGLANQLNLSGRTTESLEVASRGLRRLTVRISPLRVRLLAVSGVSRSLLGDHDGGAALTAEAVDLAERLGGEALGGALVARCAHHFTWGELTEGVSVGMRGATVCRSRGHLGSLATALTYVRLALITMGRFEDAARLRDQLGHLDAQLVRPGPRLFLAALAEFCTSGDLEAAERSAADALATCRSTDMAWRTDAHVMLGTVAFRRGDWDQAMAAFDEATTLEEGAPAALAGAAAAFRVLVRAYSGDPAGALAMFEERRRGLRQPGRPRHLRDWAALLTLPEALTVVGATREAAALYPVVREAVDTGMVLRYYDCALIQAVAGQCAVAAGDWAAAEGHYRTALRQADELPHRIAQPEVRRWFAQMLLDRDAPGDAEQARQLLARAVEGYRRVGMPRHVEMAERLLTPTSSLRGVAEPRPLPARRQPDRDGDLIPRR